MLASDVMTSNPVTAKPETSIRQAIEVLTSTQIRHLPVVNDQSQLLGIVSDRDLMLFDPRNAENGFQDVEFVARLDQPLSSFMSDAVVFVGPRDHVVNVIEQLVTHRLTAVPVAESDGTLVGIISYVDLLIAMQRMLEKMPEGI